MDYTTPKDLAEHALENAEASRDFEERYIADLLDHLARHRATLKRCRSDVERLTEIVKEAD